MKIILENKIFEVWNSWKYDFESLTFLKNLNVTIRKSDIPKNHILKVWHFLKWHLESLTCWNSDILRVWHFENLTFWKSDILKTWHFESLRFLKVTFWKSDIFKSFFLENLTTLKMIPLYDLYKRPWIWPQINNFFSSQSMATTTILWTNTQSLSLLSMTHTKATTPQITLLLISLVLLKKLNEIQCSLLQMLAVEPLDTIQR